MKSGEEFIFNPDITGVGNGGKITYSTNSYARADNGNYKISLENNQTAGTQYVVAAYPREKYVGKTVQASIASYGIFQEGDSLGNTGKVLLAKDEIEFVIPSDFDFIDNEGDIHGIKVSEYEKKISEDPVFANEVSQNGGHLPGHKMKTGDIQTFYLGFSKKTFGNPNIYSVELVDDFLYITQSDGTYRQLKKDDYSIESVDLLPVNSITNENGLPIQSDVYDVRVFAVQEDETYVSNESTLVWEGKWKDIKQSITLPEGTTAVGVKVENIREAVYPDWTGNKDLLREPVAAVNICFHLAEDSFEDAQKSNLDAGQLVNTMFSSVYDSQNNRIQEHGSEDKYLDGDINIDLAQKDLDTYGTYLDREKGAITFYGSEKSDYRSTTSLSSIAREGNRYTAQMKIGAKFDFSVEETPDKFSIYTVLPDMVSLEGYDLEEDLWNVVDLKGFGLSSNVLTSHCKAEVIKDYNSSGRTYMAFQFDLSDLTVPNESDLMVSFDVEIDKSYFRNSRASVNVRSAVLLDKDVNLYMIGKHNDDGKWAEDEKLLCDIDGDGVEMEFLAYSYDYSVYTYVDSGELQMSKAVKASSVKDYVQLPEVPMAEMGSEYSYELSLQNGNGVSRNIIVKDVLETGADSEWKGIFKGIDLSGADSMNLSYNVWYSDKTNPGQIGSTDWKASMDTAKVKAVAVDFGESELQPGAELKLYVKMTAPEDDSLKGKETENSFSVSFMMEDAVTGNESKFDLLTSNPVRTKLTAVLKNLVITKTDEETSERLIGAQYSLINKDTGEKVFTEITNSNGQIIFKNIPSDVTYLIREDVAPKGYETGEDHNLIFGDEQTIRIILKNKRKKTSVMLVKSNELDDFLKIQDAEYTLYSSDGLEIKKAKTDINGKAAFEDIEWGSYYIQETKAPAGYELDTKKFDFTVNKDNVDEIQRFYPTNKQKVSTKVALRKYSMTTQGVQTEEPVTSAAFELIRVTGNQNTLLGTYVTDRDGCIAVEEMAYGDYIFKETRVPAGYEKTEDVVFSLSPEYPETEMVVYNKRKSGSVHLHKTDEMGNVVEGAVFELYDSTQMNVLGTYITDKAGNITINDLEWDTYYLREKSTPECYILDQSWIEVKIVGAALNHNLDFVNETKKGTVVLTKTDEIGQNRLEGAVFNLYKEDGTLLNSGLKTNKNGELKVDGLEWGKYYFKEIIPPVGYGMTDETVRFSVNSMNAGAEQGVYIANPLDAKTIRITKKISAEDINFSNGDPTFLFRISGADVNGNEHTYYRIVKFDENYVSANTDRNGYVSQLVTVSGLVAGVYTITEEESSRYSLSAITDISSNASLKGESVVFDITTDDVGCASFINDKYEWADYSDNRSAANILKKQARLTALKAGWTGNLPVMAKGEIDRSLVKVTAVYDDGSTKEIPENEWSFGKEFYGIRFPNINGDYQIPVSYTENGITKTASFEVSIYGSVTKSAIRIEAVFNKDYIVPDTDITLDMFDVTVIYDDNSKEVAAEDDYLIDKERSPAAEGIFVVGISLNQEKYDEDVTGIFERVNILVKYPDPVLANGTRFRGEIPSMVTSVVFTDETAPDGTEIVDLSRNRNHSVVGWLEGTVWKVSTQRTGVRAIANQNCREMFFNETQLTEIDFTYLDTSKVTNMTNMFYNCNGLTSLDLSTFHTPSVTNMNHMFYCCTGLTSMEMSNFDTSTVTDMEYMFGECINLKKLDLSGFDTNSVKKASGMFLDCYRLAKITFGENSTISGKLAAPEENYIEGADGYWYSQKTGIKYMPTQIPLHTADTYTAVKVTNPASGMLVSGTVFKAGIPQTAISVVFTDRTAPETASLTDVSELGDGSVVSWLDGTSYYVSSQKKGIKILANSSCHKMFCENSGLKEIDFTNLDTSSVTDMSYMFYYCSGITSLNLSTFDTSKVTNMEYLFSGCSGIASLDVSGFDTSSVTNMKQIFSGCSKLTSLDLNNFDTSKVTDMSNMFYSCRGLTSLDVSSFDTSKVTNMSYMFYYCDGLQSLDVSSFDTSSVTNMAYMFYYCRKLTNLNVNGFATSKVTNMSNMFAFCIYLTNLDVSSFNTSSVTVNTNVFNNCYRLARISFGENSTISNKLTAPRANYIDGADGYWYSLKTGTKYLPADIPLHAADTYTAIRETETVSGMLISGTIFGSTIPSSATSVVFTDRTAPETAGLTDVSESGDGSVVSWLEGTTYYVSTQKTGVKILANNSCYKMFYGKSGLKEISLDNLDTSSETNMSGMFYKCSGLTNVDISGLDTSSAKNMLGMFYNCSNLTDLNVSGFETSSVKDMSYMFYNCSGLANLNVSGFETSSVTDMSYMFYNCSGLSSLNVSNFATSSVTNMSYMFDNCSGLTSLDVSDFDTSKVTDMKYMFYGCSGLTSLDLSSFDVSSVTFMSYMFRSCRGLESLDLSGFDTSSVIDMSYMFYYCDGLESIDVSGFDTSSVTNMNYMFYYCRNLKSLDLSSFHLASLSQMSRIFYRCDSVRTAYARTQEEADRFNLLGTNDKPGTLSFAVK